MANNELVLVDQAFAEWLEGQPAGTPEDEGFERFVAEHLLIDSGFSVDEIHDGVIGGGGDGGIDGVYVTLGERLLAEDSDVFDEDFRVSSVEVGARLGLTLFQAKRSPAFGETAIDKASSSLCRLLDLQSAPEELLELFSTELVSKFEVYRGALRKLATRHPRVEIDFAYITRGETEGVDPKVMKKADDLAKQLGELAPGEAEPFVRLIGAKEMYGSIAALPSYTLELPFKENASSGTSHVALVSIRDFLTFITDDAGNLLRHIFDWNVRDYQGHVEVNREIDRTLRDSESPEFWWLNNGVTVLCSNASIVSKEYIVDDVQIVNGLQTSHTIHRALGGADPVDPALDKTLLVRLIVTEDPSTRDAIIRATNRQTTVSAASLRATDEIHRQIETFFASHDWFYDRRKNYYRNLGKPTARIVGIPLLAQAVVAMGLGRPDDARARPSSLLKSDDEYERVFPAKLPLEVYLWLARSMKAIDGYLQAVPVSELPASARTNIRFHFAAVSAARLVGGRIYNPSQLRQIVEDGREIADADLDCCFRDVAAAFEEWFDLWREPADKVAKGRPFVEFLWERFFP